MSNAKQSKKSRKFLPINKSENEAYVMPGRVKCDCAATKHELINNCTGCGRIVCIQEGAGPCWFCGDIVCTNHDLNKIRSNSGHGRDLLKALQKEIWSHQIDQKVATNNIEHQPASTADMNRAQAAKERLLEFDRNSVCRTRVIDDQKDYFNADGNTWLSSEQRDLLKKRETELRSKRFMDKWKAPKTFRIDPETGKLLENENNESTDAANELFEDQNIYLTQTTLAVHREDNIDTDFISFLSSKPMNPKISDKENKWQNQSEATKKLLRIQDKELHQIRDDGMCLSMHQPWASLLVAGFKKHEGRSWYTNHRGRLWIAATAKEMHQEDLDTCRKFYESRGLSSSQFPESYPVGCILGCAELTECLPSEDYKEQYPDGESDSPYVFVCENPHELTIKFPLKGKNKIYKLEQHIHHAAKCGLRNED